MMEEEYRGIVLRESLKDGTVPAALRAYVVGSYPYALDGRVPMTAMKFTIPRAKVLDVAWILSSHLRDEHFFAQLTGREEMLVALPNSVVLVKKDQPETAVRARSLGAIFGIPAHQMQFEQMFENDHPNQSK